MMYDDTCSIALACVIIMIDMLCYAMLFFKLCYNVIVML